MAPYNVLMYMFSAVSNRPVLQQDLVPELAELRDNWRMTKRRSPCSS
jgi:aspartyl/asparaginyl beta-hydroxylase (cupin superfamily)